MNAQTGSRWPLAASAIAALAVGLSGIGGSGPAFDIAAGLLVRIDPATNQVVATIPVGLRPGAVAVSGSRVYVANYDDGTVSRIDPRTNSVERTIGVGGSPSDLALSGRPETVWVAGALGGAVAEIRAYTDSTFGVGSALFGQGLRGASVAFGAGSLWVVPLYGDAYAISSGTLLRIAPWSRPAGGTVGGKLLRTIDLEAAPGQVAFVGGSAWVASHDGRLLRVDSRTNRVSARIRVGKHIHGIAVGDGAVWVADCPRGPKTVSRIDVGTSRITQTIPVQGCPDQIAVGRGAVWVTFPEDRVISRIDPTVGKVVSTIDVGGEPYGVGVGSGGVWVTAQQA